MLLALLVAATVTVGAASLSYLYDDDAPLFVRLANGVCVGTALSGFIGYCLALQLGLRPLTVLLGALPLLSPLVVFFWPGPRARLLQDVRRLRRFRLRSPGHRALLVSFALCATLLFVLFRGIAEARPGGLYTINHHNIGDLPWHLAIIQGFAVGENFPPQHVEFAGTRLTYPFLVNFVAAQYVACGTSLTAALLLQNLTLSASLLVLLPRWAFRITRNARVAALVSPVVLLSGGWGWWYFVTETRTSSLSFTEALRHLPHDYTTSANDFRWANSTTTLFLTQRGLLLAVPLALIVLTLLWEAWRPATLANDNAAPRRLIWAGCVTGLLPLVHGHTFLSLVLVAGGLALLDLITSRVRWKRWAGFFLPAVLLALPQARTLAEKTGVRTGAFMGWQPGWEATALNQNFAYFWLRNTGPLFPLLLLVLLWSVLRWRSGPVSPRLLGYYAPFLLCFIVPSLFRLAPWGWDNMKVFLYWFFPSVVLTLTLLSRSWARGGIWGKAASMTCVALLCASGGLDVWRVASRQNEQQVFDSAGIAFAERLRRATPPNSVLLHAPAYNHPALLSGRRLLAGYGGHLWSHGLDFESRVADVKRIYAGDPETPALLARYGVTHVLVGPQEQVSADVRPNLAYWSRHPIAFENGSYRVYKVSNP